MAKILTEDIIPELKGKIPSQTSVRLESNTAGGLYMYTIGNVCFIIGDVILNGTGKSITLPFTVARVRGTATAFGNSVGGNLPGGVTCTNNNVMNIGFPSAVTFAHVSAIGFIE